MFGFKKIDSMVVDCRVLFITMLDNYCKPLFGMSELAVSPSKMAELQNGRKAKEVMCIVRHCIDTISNSDQFIDG